MLSIWIGRAGSGKSARVLETIQRERENRPQLLLVPEHTSHEAELDLCRFCGPTACRSAEVLTFQSLATRVLGETGGLADVTLDNGGKLLTMRRCLQELHTQLGIPAPADHAGRRILRLSDRAGDAVPPCGGHGGRHGR